MKVIIKAERGNGKTNTLIMIAKSYLAENKTVLFVVSYDDQIRELQEKLKDKKNLFFRSGKNYPVGLHVDCLLIDESQTIKNKEDMFYPCVAAKNGTIYEVIGG